MFKFLIAISVLLALAAPARAQHEHGHKGPNGGLMEDVAGVHAELLTSGTTLTINIIDDDHKPMKVAGYSASALIVRGANRETIELEPAGDVSLKGQAKARLAADTQITLMLKTPAGKSGQARFVMAR